jgi:hypothetical protein
MMSSRRPFSEEDCIHVMATPLAKKSQREQQQLGLERTLFHSTTPFGKNDNDMVGAGPDSCTVLDLLMGLCTASGYNFGLPER